MVEWAGVRHRASLRGLDLRVPPDRAGDGGGPAAQLGRLWGETYGMIASETAIRIRLSRSCCAIPARDIFP